MSMGFGMGGFDSLMFTIAPIFIIVIFVAVVGMLVVTAVRGAATWSKNNDSPRLTVSAQVVSKRTRVSGGSGDLMTSTTYYATFQVESGDRMEFHVTGQEYGLIAEGDNGILSFQGTRYLSFERTLE